jgi:magnesium chelatase family protein
VAHAVADLDAAETVGAKHIADAVQYRSLDRNYWS